MAVAGVIWVPDPSIIGTDPAHYAAEMKAYANSLHATYGQKPVPLYYDQPTPQLIPGISVPSAPGGDALTFGQWTKTLEWTAQRLAKKVK